MFFLQNWDTVFIMQESLGDGHRKGKTKGISWREKNKTKGPFLETNQNVAGNPNNHNEQSVEGSDAKQQVNTRPSRHSGALNRVWLTSKSHPGRILAS